MNRIKWALLVIVLLLYSCGNNGTRRSSNGTQNQKSDIHKKIESDYKFISELLNDLKIEHREYVRILRINSFGYSCFLSIAPIENDSLVFNKMVFESHRIKTEGQLEVIESDEKTVKYEGKLIDSKFWKLDMGELSDSPDGFQIYIESSLDSDYNLIRRNNTAINNLGLFRSDLSKTIDEYMSR